MAALQVTSVYYPESDGKPMGETDWHIDAIIRHREILRRYFAGQEVYVSGNLLLYYEQGNPKKCVVPDTFVVKGLKQRPRRIFKTWVERKVPNVVIETTSRKTRKKDLGEKSELYARLGVKEYFLFDPDNDYLDPPLQGHRLVGAKYEPITTDDSGCLLSEELALKLFPGEGAIQFFRLDTGERLLSESEAAASDYAALQESEAARLRAEAESKAAKTSSLKAEAAREAAEAEVARLREELARRTK